MSLEPISLVAMRLIDMHKVHPQQVTLTCAFCGELVGVYPTGQKALRLGPRRMKIMCNVCHAATYDKRDVSMLAAPFPEIAAEMRDSIRVKKT